MAPRSWSKDDKERWALGPPVLNHDWGHYEFHDGHSHTGRVRRFL